MMPDPNRFLAGLRIAGGLFLLASSFGCATATGQVTSPQAVPQRGESEWILAAEQALDEGSCRLSAEYFLNAARVSRDAEVASRATQLALGCQQLPVAQQAAQRWRELAPASGDAALVQTLVALRRYDLDTARQALVAWRDSGLAGGQDPLRFTQQLAQRGGTTATYQVFGQVLVGDYPTSDVRLAQARLALDAQDMNGAATAARQARDLGATLAETVPIELRARAMLGQTDMAIEGARALGDALGEEHAFLLADLLGIADRDGELRDELERLAAQPATQQEARYRLIALAFAQGDYDAVEAGLAPMASGRGGTVLDYLYLAQLAERRGDVRSALQAYQQVFGSPLESSARTAAARLLLRRGNRDGALRLLDGADTRSPETQIEAGSTRAQLLAQYGDVTGALAGLDDLLRRYPGHPDLLYQRATVLETGGRTRDAITQLEQLHDQRPADPQISNALGFTLADHGQRLSKAEQLVRQALSVSPDSPAMQDSLGWVLFRRGRVGDSVPVLERAWLNSRDAEIGAHFGEALWKSGNEGQARYVWQQALNLDPDDALLLATVKRLTGEAPAVAR